MLNAVIGSIAVAVAVLWFIPRSNRLAIVMGRGTRACESDSIVEFLRSRREHRSTPKQAFVRDLRALASELRSGTVPQTALTRAAGKQVLWPRALAAARFGDSVEDGFMRDALENRELASFLRQLAACWRVSLSQGAGLASSIDRLAQGVQAQIELQATLDSELAAPRATGRLLALLPIVGVGMAYLLGADPLAWFVGTVAGGLTFGLALVLTVLGALWSRRIVRRVEVGLR